MYNGNWWWTLSLSDYDLGKREVLIAIINDGRIQRAWGANALGVRPVIVLPHIATYLSGDGSGTSPYVITY